MKARPAFLLPCIICCLVFVSFAADDGSNPSALFYKANMAYEQGKFDEAIKGYQGALKTGFESGNIYYNLGNAYFKKGDIGRAILNYKRAQRLIPADPDLRQNLEYAMTAVQQQPVQEANPFIRPIAKAIKDLNVDTLARILAIFYIMIFLFATAMLFFKNARRRIKAPLFASCAIFLIVAGGFVVNLKQINQPWAVVLDKEAEAKYEPLDSATGYFKLFEGQEVLLIKTRPDWAFIKLADGKAGWIKSSGVEKVALPYTD